MKLPLFEEIVKKIEQSTNLKKEEILENIRKLKTSYQGFVSSDELAGYLYAQEKKIEIPISFETRQRKTVEGITPIVSLNKLEDNSIVNIEGYLLNANEGQTVTGKKCFWFCLVDRTGYAKGIAFDPLNKKVGSFLSLENARVRVENGRSTIALSSRYSAIEEKEPLYTLESIVTDAKENNLTDSALRKIQGICLNILKTEYYACPVCKTSLGSESKHNIVTCTKCGKNAKGVKSEWKRLVISNGFLTFTCVLAPDQKINDKDVLLQRLRVYGTYRADANEFRVLKCEAIGEGLQKYPVFFKKPLEKEILALLEKGTTRKELLALESKGFKKEEIVAFIKKLEEEDRLYESDNKLYIF